MVTRIVEVILKHYSHELLKVYILFDGLTFSTHAFTETRSPFSFALITAMS